MISALSRRRFISISAGTLAAGIVPGTAAFARSSSVRWQGIAMGAAAKLILDHPDQKQAKIALQAVREEIRRLEAVFNLFDPSSAISRLNLKGRLELPPLDLIRCLDDAAQISQLTDGAFDVTVQPLWALYASHFADQPKDTKGPSQKNIDAARAHIDYQAVQYGPEAVTFSMPNMAITLNGIAQGYMTDRVAELLGGLGFDNVLIHLGETRGLGTRSDGSSWKVGIKSPDSPVDLVEKIELNNKAIATSGGYGTRFTGQGQHHHLFDPKSGRSANTWSSISVVADDATRADALSTAFYSMPKKAILKLKQTLDVRVIAYDEDLNLL